MRIHREVESLSDPEAGAENLTGASAPGAALQLVENIPTRRVAVWDEPRKVLLKEAAAIRRNTMTR